MGGLKKISLSISIFPHQIKSFLFTLIFDCILFQLQFSHLEMDFLSFENFWEKGGYKCYHSLIRVEIRYAWIFNGYLYDFFIV